MAKRLQKNSFLITGVDVRKVFDAHGLPALRSRVRVANGSFGEVTVAFGEQSGARLHGDSLEKRLAAVLKHIATKIIPKLRGMDVRKQKSVDALLMAADGTVEKTVLGSEVVFSLSAAVARACAHALQIPEYQYVSEYLSDTADLSSRRRMTAPVPILNVVSGRLSGDTSLDVAEVFIIPRCAGRHARTVRFEDRMQVSMDVFSAVRTILHEQVSCIGTGVRGGYAASIHSLPAFFEQLVRAVQGAKVVIGSDIAFGVRIGALGVFDHVSGAQNISIGGEYLSRDQVIETILSWCRRYPISYIEDALAENDWYGFAMLVADMRDRSAEHVHGIVPDIAGRALLDGRISRLRHANHLDAITAAVVVPEHIGTISEIARFVQEARDADRTIVFARGDRAAGDVFLADYAYAAHADFINAGGLLRAECSAVYNRCCDIESAFV